MLNDKEKKNIHPAYVVFACLIVLAAGFLILVQTLNLDPDMVKLSSDNKIHEGVISAIGEKGVVILDARNNEKTIYRPIVPIADNKNPALEFTFFAEAQEARKSVCFLTAVTEGNDSVKLAYNFHVCGDLTVGTSQVVPGKEQYVSTLRSFGKTTLIGFEDGTRAGDKGNSQLDKNKYLLVSSGDSVVRIERATAYGFPNGRYDSEDIGKRFCITQHSIANVKFSNDLKPIGIWESKNTGVYLWTCKAAENVYQQSYIELFE
ncbi:hypothetical protein PS850_06127 [Pseudomonas fluorescens]|nr:hypothetical protein PS850_06127 [Pseudomonas fluorescens]